LIMIKTGKGVLPLMDMAGPLLYVLK